MFPRLELLECKAEGGVKSEAGNADSGSWGVGGEGSDTGSFLPAFFMSW